MMWWNHSWGSGWGWILVMAVVMVVCVAMMARMIRHGGSWRMGPADTRDEDAPERILARRLASGEIDVAEFERLRDALRRTSNSTADAAEPSSAERRPPPA
jgi:uncharacterized membrane protein